MIGEPQADSRISSHSQDPAEESGIVKLAAVSGQKTRLAIIDRHPFTRACLADMFRTADTEFEVAAYSNSDELLADIGSDSIDIAVYYSGTKSVAAVLSNDVDRMRKQRPALAVVLLSDNPYDPTTAEALGRGVRGYIPTTLPPNVAMAAIRLIAVGGVFTPPQGLLAGPSGTTTEHTVAVTFGRSWRDHFTPRQIEVLGLLEIGKSNKQIAYELGVNECTIKVHIRDIMRKLKATNRTHAVHLISQLTGPSDCGSQV